MPRTTDFNARLAERMVSLAKRGLTNEEIAKESGIAAGTLYIWQRKHKSFAEALKRAKSMADELVEASLFRRACGYDAPAVKFFFDKTKGKVFAQHYIEHYPPSEVACIFWLKNRQPKAWRDKHELSADANLQTSIASMSTAELLKLIQQHFAKKDAARENAARVPPEGAWEKPEKDAAGRDSRPAE